MADTDVRHAQNDIAPPSGISYKDKLLQPSDRDELSVPDQPEKPKLPPTKDEGSPPMTVPTEAPAGAGDDSAAEGAPAEGASTTDTSASDATAAGDRGARSRKADAADDDTAGTATQITIPDTSGDTSLAGTELSDIEKEAISDPSTADLIAAVTGDTSAAATEINDEPAPANVVTINEDGTTDVSAVLPGPGSKAGTPIVTAADAAAGSTGTAAAPEPDDQGQGELLGEKLEIKVPSDESAGVGSSAGTAGDDSAVRNAPAAALGMPVGTSSDTAAAAAGSTAAAERDLPHAMSILTASDAAAAGLANLESQLDAGRAFSRLDSTSSWGSSISRGGSVMSRAETGNIIDFTSPAAARHTLPDSLLDAGDGAAADESAAAPGGNAAATAAGSGGSTEPAESGIAAAYGHLQQAPAAAEDAAAVPAGSDGSSGDTGGSSDVKAEAGPVEAPSVPEPAVGADKDAEVVSDAAAAAGSSDILKPEQQAGDDSTAAEEDDSSSSEHQNPLEAAVEAVAEPVAAALTNLKDVLLGHDITLGESNTDNVKSESEVSSE